MNTLIGIDFDKDFINGRLANPLAQAVLEKAVKKIENHQGPVILTEDMHDGRYYKFSLEGQHIPEHCDVYAKDQGYEIEPNIYRAAKPKLIQIVEKHTFGCLNWGLEKDDPNYLPEMRRVLEQAETITVIGFVSEICVIANLIILRAMFPDKRIIWDSTCSAGLPNEHGEQPGHEAAKAVARAQQIEVIE